MAKTRTVGGDERLLTHLQTLKQGDLMTPAQVLDITGWSSSTLKTYTSKHKLAQFLALDKSTGCYMALQDGSSISYSSFSNAFTQVSPLVHTPAKGIQLAGATRKYTLMEQVGSGAVAQVWKCFYNAGSGSSFAAAKIMVPRPEFIESGKVADVAKRFRKEVQNGAQFDDPNIVRILDGGDFGEKPFLIMELAECSARSLLRGKSRLPLERASSIILSCARGLSVLHTKNCVHRDIKPDNILLRGNRCMLGDLGVVMWDYLNPAFTRAGTLTRDSVILGSLLYMAPEQQRRSRNATTASDVYSLGVTWIELLLGDVPGPADIVTGNYQNPSQDAEVAAFIKSMVNYVPAARPTAQDVADFAQRWSSAEWT